MVEARQGARELLVPGSLLSTTQAGGRCCRLPVGYWPSSSPTLRSRPEAAERSAEDPTAGSRLGRCRTLEVVRIEGSRRSTPEDFDIGGNTHTSPAADRIAGTEELVPAEEVPVVQEVPGAQAAPEALVLALVDPAGQADPVQGVRAALVPAVLAALVPAVLAAQAPEVPEGQVPAVPVGLVVLVVLGSALPAAVQVGPLPDLAHLFLH